MKEQIFISSFWHSNHSKKALIERFKKYALELEKNKKSTIKSNQGGFHSKNLACSISLFSEFKEMIQPEIIEYCDSLHLKKPYNLIYKLWWLNINRFTHYNQPHNHARSILSAVYYIQVPKNSGDFYFYSNQFKNLHGLDYNSYTQENSTFWKWRPCAGDFLLFPSNILHSVGVNLNSKPRISLSFNLDIQQV